MPVPLSPRRRKIAVLGGTTAALAGSLNLLHSTGASDSRFYTVLGIASGIVVGIALVFLRKRRGNPACSN